MIWFKYSLGLVASIMKICSLLLLLPQNAMAGGLGDLDPRLKHASAIENVAVSMEAPRDYDRVKRLPQYSCTYTSSNPKKIADILKSFAEFNVRKMPENQVFLPIVEIEIHFSFKDGQKAVLYLGKRYLGEKTIDGELTIDNQSIPLLFWVNRNLSERLLRWVQSADDVIMHKDRYKYEEQLCRDKSTEKYYRDIGVGSCRRPNMLSYPELCGNN